MKETARRFLKNRRVAILLVAVVAVVGSAFGYWKFNRSEAKADYLTAQIERGDIIKTISATGAIQALVTVQVGSQVSGTIAELFADYNSVVKKGQVVAKLDPAIFQAQLDQAQANLANAQASIRTAESAVVNAEANLLAAEANQERARVAMEDARRLLNRMLELRESNVVSQRDLESAQASADQTAAQYRQATAQVDQAKAQVHSAKSQLNQAKAQELQAKAAVQLASVNLSHTIITAPIDGVVVARNVDVGQTVAASLQAPTLFLIANDLTKMQVLANIDEADVGQLGPESRVTFTVDAYARDVFRGRISQIRLNPETVQNVVTYTAVIDVENPELKLKPGMTANVTVTVAERREVLKLPNAALRFRPELTDAQQKEVAALLKEPGPGRAGSESAPTSGASDGEPSSARRAGWAETPQPFAQRPEAQSRRAAGSTGASRSSAQKSEAQSRKAPMAGTITGWSLVKNERPRIQPVWVLGANNQLRPVRVKLGITDGVYSELIEGDLKEQDVIVIGQNLGPNDSTTQRPTAPFGGPFGGAPRRR
jgi:HlyD family secretion protein